MRYSFGFCRLYGMEVRIQNVMIHKKTSNIILRPKEKELKAVKLATEKKNITVSDFKNEWMNLPSRIIKRLDK